jgi:hypothetical protein
LDGINVLRWLLDNGAAITATIAFAAVINQIRKRRQQAPAAAPQPPEGGRDRGRLLAALTQRLNPAPVTPAQAAAAPPPRPQAVQPRPQRRAPAPAPAQPAVPLLAPLRSRGALLSAFVLSEALAPPAGLRGPYDGPR